MTAENFMDILCQFDDTASQFEQDDFVYPVGQYNVMLADKKAGVKEKDGNKTAWVKLTYTIQDGPFAGQNLNDRFYFATNRNKPDEAWDLRRYVSLASLLAGTPLKAASLADSVIDKNTGALIVLDREDFASKKTAGKIIHSIRYRSAQATAAYLASPATPTTS